MFSDFLKKLFIEYTASDADFKERIGEKTDFFFIYSRFRHFSA